jgi:uncharacterized protein with HEPN domain
MDRKAAKALLHMKVWFERVDEITEHGEDAYLADAILQEAGDSLMMKLGEAANRLSKVQVLAPHGIEWAEAIANRNFLIHQYDVIDRKITWASLANDLPAWRASLEELFAGAEASLEHGAAVDIDAE